MGSELEKELNSAKSSERSPVSDSPSGSGARMTYSDRKVLNVGKEVTNFAGRQIFS